MACTFLHTSRQKINLDFVIGKVFYLKMYWQLARLTYSSYSFILAGKAADSRILRAVLDDPDQNFPQIPEGLITPIIFMASNY
jgi:hypothetical protein